MEFFRVGEVLSDFKMTSYSHDELLIININHDTKILQYERTVFSFFDAISNIGGVFGLLLQVGVILTGSFSEIYFLTSVFSYLYTTCQGTLVKNNVRKVQSRLMHHNKSMSISELKETEKPFSPDPKKPESGKPKLASSLSNTCEQHLKGIRRAKFSSCDYCKTLIPFFPSKSKLGFEELSDKLSQELDVVEIIHSIRAIKVIMKLLLKVHQQRLVSYSTQVQDQLTQIFSEKFSK
ncbi:unnamed protein product [Moneuplotes crassus]|uniref:Uncharacterized protein n=1 Tax=Euplotes crassus TaxID=5936 RepID=A0AAD1U597_EUPCR|nr:unnamed protein product [Moneuplotes crassus]